MNDFIDGWVYGSYGEHVDLCATCGKEIFVRKVAERNVCDDCSGQWVEDPKLRRRIS